MQSAILKPIRNFWLQLFYRAVGILPGGVAASCIANLALKLDFLPLHFFFLFSPILRPSVCLHMPYSIQLRKISLLSTCLYGPLLSVFENLA